MNVSQRTITLTKEIWECHIESCRRTHYTQSGAERCQRQAASRPRRREQATRDDVVAILHLLSQADASANLDIMARHLSRSCGLRFEATCDLLLYIEHALVRSVDNVPYAHIKDWRQWNQYRESILRDLDCNKVRVME